MNNAEFIIFICTLIGAISAVFAMIKSKKEGDIRIGKVDTELIHLSNRINEVDNNYERLYNEISRKITNLEDKQESSSKEVMLELKNISNSITELTVKSKILERLCKNYGQC